MPRNIRNDEKGLTLIGLLLIILLIGIAAAFVLPSLLNERANNKAKDYAETAQVAAKTYDMDNGGYTGLTSEYLMQQPELSDAEQISVSRADDNNFAIDVVSTTGDIYTVASIGGRDLRCVTREGDQDCAW